MDRHLGRLAGIFAFALVVLRLGRLLQSGPQLPDWRLILLASVVLGGVVWWLLGQLIANRAVAASVFGLAAAVLFLRVAVPDTLIAGILPSGDTWPALGIELEQAVRLIRHGVPPIIPVEGVIAILAVLVWAMGGLFAWGAAGGPVAAMVLPSIVVYLQFAIFDRIGAGLGWMTASGIMLSVAIAAMAIERRGDAGRARDAGGRPLPRKSLTLAVVMATLLGIVATVTADRAAGLVSEYGNVPWRSGTGGPGLGSGGVSYGRFVDLRQRLVSPDNTLLFTVTFDGREPPADQIYWRLETLDHFDGRGWLPSQGSVRAYEPGRELGHPSNRYQGSAVEFTTRIHIGGLRGEIAPTAGVPTEIRPVDSARAIEPRGFQILIDSALWYSAGLRDGDIYETTSVQAVESEDIGALATMADGQLSPLFAIARREGTFTAEPEVLDLDIVEPEDLDYFTELPDLPLAVRGTAARVTLGASTDFERAWMLQNWFRDSGDFEYSLDVDSGHTFLDLENWLTDTTSLNYRKGYCEQFATSMAVLGRALGIPSRVVLGFTPGTPGEVNGLEVVTVSDTNAHAWVEMWMDGFGWVRFDPTPRGEFLTESLTAQTDLARYAALRELEQNGINAPSLDGADVTGFVEDPPPPLGTTTGTRWWLIVPLILIVLASMVPLAKVFRRRRRVEAIRSGDITAAWDEIVDRLNDLGDPVPASKTPIEFARETDPALLALAVTYSAAVYGGRQGRGRETDLYDVEGWLIGKYDGMARTRASMSPRSLLRRD